jgi:hypothetical protein
MMNGFNRFAVERTNVHKYGMVNCCNRFATDRRKRLHYYCEKKRYREGVGDERL